MARAPILAFLSLLAAPALAQEPPRCAASGWDTLRTADQVIADVARHRCPAGSRLDVAMTIAGQAIVLQRSGLCQPDTVNTRTVRPTADTKALGFRCDLAPR
ncbi:MAG: hypothetical protein NTY94_20195 [Alphaproteobacteria bacterium]|nr:hypothetical protein [Alphaproteobacteria bacterium]